MAMPPFSPLNIPPGSGPDLNSDKQWYRRGWMWLLVALVALCSFWFR